MLCDVIDIRTKDNFEKWCGIKDLNITEGWKRLWGCYFNSCERNIIFIHGGGGWGTFSFGTLGKRENRYFKMVVRERAKLGKPLIWIKNQGRWMRKINKQWNKVFRHQISIHSLGITIFSDYLLSNIKDISELFTHTSTRS